MRFSLNKDLQRFVVHSRAVVRTGATGVIAPIDFEREAQIAPVDQDLIIIHLLAPVDCIL